MKNFLYFVSLDLMVRVEYDRLENRLFYSSHRQMTQEEKISVEVYILRNVAPKTSYFDKIPSRFIYLGIEQVLEDELKLYHLRNTLQEMVDRELELDTAVKSLINQSLSEYYFELIGNEIIELRKQIQQANDAQLSKSEIKIAKLVEAYNQYSGKSFKLDDVIPKEIRDHLRTFSAEEHI